MKILIISDVHANQVALEAVLSAAGSYDEIWNLGDTIGYGPRPRECLERMRELAPPVNLSGNHDRAVTGDISIKDFNPAAAAATEWTRTQLDDSDLEYLRELPSKTQRDGYLQVHGSPREPVWEYVTQTRAARENFQVFEQPICFLGHSHLQVYWSESMAKSGSPAGIPTNGERLAVESDRFIVNPGSVGQPRDHNPLAAFALFDTDRSEITFRRVLYDVVETQTQMEQAGLPPMLISRLTMGV